jgi:hypothetical protein
VAFHVRRARLAPWPPRPHSACPASPLACRHQVTTRGGLGREPRSLERHVRMPRPLDLQTQESGQYDQDDRGHQTEESPGVGASGSRIWRLPCPSSLKPDRRLDQVRSGHVHRPAPRPLRRAKCPSGLEDRSNAGAKPCRPDGAVAEDPEPSLSAFKRRASRQSRRPGGGRSGWLGVPPPCSHVVPSSNTGSRSRGCCCVSSR